MSTIGVPSIRSAPLTSMVGAPSPVKLIFSIFTQLIAIGFGRKLLRVAKTPSRVFPPSLGGRTVGFQVSRTFSEKIHRSHK